MFGTSSFPRRARSGVVVAVFAVLPMSALSQGAAPKGIHWNFDEASGAVTVDSLGSTEDKIMGFSNRVPGVAGNALQFDGYTTRIIRPAKKVPVLGDSFTISSWVALDNYPWNWVPIADQNMDAQIGFFFGIDAFGHLGLQLSVNGLWVQVTSDSRLPLKKWSRVSATFSKERGAALYINGQPAGQLKTVGSFVQADHVDLLIGRVRTPQLPFPSWLIHPHDAVYYSLDGYLDELEITPGERAASEEMQSFSSVKVPQGDVIPYAVLPSGGTGPAEFGVVYATLKFVNTWDRLRRFGPDSDVVVRFENSPIRLVFWQGTNFVPAWVTENGKWYCDQFLEAWDLPRCTGGEDCEPMSDKQSRYSRASILESSPARAVIHWRYALADTRNYQGASPDPDTGWFDWADEYWTVYPDGVAIRKQLLWSADLNNDDHQWQETIVINGPGQRPEDNIELDALTLENMQGETHTYHWGAKTDENFGYTKGPSKLDLPAGANIQIVNLKSQWKPFQIVSPAGGVRYHTYGSEKSYSTFEWWNHWPVSQIQSSGRPAVAPDRASHSSLSDFIWGNYALTDQVETKIMMAGLTSSPSQSLVPLAKSWISPPKITAIGNNVVGAEYDPTQRAFVIHRTPGTSKLALKLQASSENPIVNPAFVVEHWSGDAKVLINGKAIDANVGGLRKGYLHDIGGDSLILWLPFTSDESVEIQLEPSQTK
jgi:Concanavalin A-like lectin/glucanases superfamily